jgi:formamidopyrimidine-DNA glycosylase
MVMPELPEVETIVRDLRPLLGGKRIAAVRAGKHRLRTPWRASWTRHVVGRLVMALRRRGKWIVAELDDGSQLLFHLGMTGQLTVRPATIAAERHTHFVFVLDDGQRQLRFRDVRRFGSVRYLRARADLEREFEGRLGPEPWDLKATSWHISWRRSRRCLKAILLDQTTVAGVGNIYADEALFAARLSPRQTGRTTTLEQAERLRAAILEVLERAIAGRGTSFSDYVGGSGLRGDFQERLQVYGRAGLPCYECRRAIACIRLAGRSTHYCPGCQRRKAGAERQSPPRATCSDV